jgi:aminoglycoside phosphotransferase (APT) family kinase protein
MTGPSSTPKARYGFDLPPDEVELLRGPLPEAARAWIREELGAGTRIVSIHPRSGGTSSAIHVVTVEDRGGTRQSLVLRRYVRADWLAEEPDLAEHEARVLELLESTAFDAPCLVAVDPTGAQCDVPAVLMTRLPGRIRWSPRAIDPRMDALVDAMLTIHAVRVPDGVPIRDFRPYSVGQHLEPPLDTSQRAAWERAIEVHAGPPPSTERAFIHRDFHPGNVLWTGDRVSGVVDWCNASIGVPEVDLGHCRINLTRELGDDRADRLSARYRKRSGRGEMHPYWDLISAVGMLDLVGTDFVWLPALDEFVARAVARL